MKKPCLSAHFILRIWKLRDFSLQLAVHLSFVKEIVCTSSYSM